MMNVRLVVLPVAVLALPSVACNTTVGGNLDGGRPPAPDGTVCFQDVDCASFSCQGISLTDLGDPNNQGTCAPPASGLIEIDGDCSGGGACVADATCESGLCVEVTNAPCLPSGHPAVAGACCTGGYVFNVTPDGTSTDVRCE